MKSKFLDLLLVTILLTTVLSGFAYSWQKTAPPLSTGFSVGMSADGRVLCAVGSAAPPSISTNGGQTWAVFPNTNFLCVSHSNDKALSADGSKIFLIMFSNGIPTASVYLTSDWGATLQQTGFPSVGISSNYVVACSADGTKVVAAVANLPILYSMNAGLNCYTSSAPSLSWKSIASSADGRRVVAASANSIYFSDDFGASWSLQTNLTSHPWSSVCVSGDGKWVGAAANNYALISNDSGASWQTFEMFGNHIACSANGSNWVNAGTYIYTSTNGLSSWETGSSGGWSDAAMSADGREIILSAPGGIWLGSETPHPQLNIQPQSPGVALSWILPSTNFVLQQSADLSDPNWTPVPTTPTLNLTNLQQQVTLPATETNTFFRLMAQ